MNEGDFAAHELSINYQPSMQEANSNNESRFSILREGKRDPSHGSETDLIAPGPSYPWNQIDINKSTSRSERQTSSHL